MEADPFSGHMTTEIIGFIISLSTCALFSFLETSVTALRLFKLKELAGSAGKYKSLLHMLEKKPHQVLSTILIANSLSNVTAAALITNIMERVFAAFHLSRGLGFSLGIGIGSFLILLFGEIIPKNIAKTQGEKLFKSSLWITNITYLALSPVVRFLSIFSNMFIRLFGGSAESTETVVSEHEIQFLIEHISQKGIIEPEKTEMLQSIFDLGKRNIKEIMIPFVDVIMIDVNKSIKDALEIFAKYQFSRLPVYQDSPDNIIGMLYQKDALLLISKNEEKAIKDLIRPILFVPESMLINQMLREFKQQRMHIAMVINEHGSVTGLVTLEDIIEEIVGEISDEYEAVKERILEIEPGNWLVDAGLALEDLADVLDIEFAVEDVVTLGGFLTKQLQHLPKKGERISFQGYIFQVQKATPKRVIQVLIFKEPPLQP